MFAPVERESRAAEEMVGAPIDAAQARIGAEERELLRAIAKAQETKDWESFGARDASHWLSMRMGISTTGKPRG